MVPRARRQTIIEHFEGLEFWREHWPQSALVITGSAVRGEKDEFADTDITVFVPRSAYGKIYEGYIAAAQDGRVEVLNPSAFQYREFPLALIPGIEGHYKVESFEDAESQVAQYDDVAMWIHQGGLVLHDPSGRYAELKERSSSYPEEVWREKVRFHYLEGWMAAAAASNPLRRNDRAAVVLTMTRCVTHVLRLCCLLDHRPFPYEKWLYHEAVRTQAGRDLKPLFDAFFEELCRPEIRRRVPASYERPGHRNADLEEFPLYMIWRQVKQRLDSRLP